MVLSNILFLSQIAGNVVASILSLCVIFPMSMHVHDFSGHCLLFTSGEWQEEDGLFNANWSSRGFCNYPIAASVLLLLISSAEIYRLTKLTIKQETPSFLSLFVGVFFGLASCIMTLISAIMITIGFIYWCSDMTQRFPSCELAAGQNITKEDLKIDTSNFYVEMGTAQFGAWGSFAIWVGLSVFALLKLVNEHKMQNMKASMYLERHKLVNEDGENGEPTVPPAVAAASSSSSSTPN